jgi:hypothetical protein
MPSVKRKAGGSAQQAKKVRCSVLQVKAHEQVKPQPISSVESEVEEDNVAEFKDPMIDSDGSGSEDEEGDETEDESAGSDDDMDPSPPKVKGKSKANPKSLFKPPTNAELMELRTGGERGGTGFALQVSFGNCENVFNVVDFCSTCFNLAASNTFEDPHEPDDLSSLFYSCSSTSSWTESASSSVTP